jgi:HK97 family phage portal protein
MSILQTPAHWTRRIGNAARTAFGEMVKASKKGRSKGEELLAKLLTGGGVYTYPSIWTHDKFEQVRRFRGWQYVAIKVIAEEAGMNRPQVGFVRSPEMVTKSLRRSGRILNRIERKKALTAVQNHEEIEIADSSHPIRRLLDNPNLPDTGFTFRYRTLVFLELTGEAYWLKVRNAFKEVIELWPLFPQWVNPRSSGEKLIDHYEIRPYGYGAAAVGVMELPPEDVVAFRYPGPMTMINGHAPVGACSEWVDVDEAIESSQWYAFENGNHPGVIFELNADVVGKGKAFDESMIERFYARFDAKHGGRDKHRRPLVVSPGMTAKPWSNTPAEMDYSKSAEASRDRVMAINRVAKMIAGLTDDVKYDNLAAGTANFLERTMGPKYAFIGETATEQLAHPDFGEDVLIYFNNNAKPDPVQQNADIQIDSTTGAITPNEIRQIRGRDPYEGWGDRPIVGGVEVMFEGDVDEQQEQQWARENEQGEIEHERAVELVEAKKPAESEKPPKEKHMTNGHANRIADVFA